jgi:hypothetical protein
MSEGSISNAKGWLEEIRTLARLIYRWDEVEDLRDLSPEELAEVEAEPLDMLESAKDFDTLDDVRDRVMGSPLSMEVRSGWTSCGRKMEAEEYCMLLTTGGPALRIIGDLDGYGGPTSARLEMQDWGEPWSAMPLTNDEECDLMIFVQEFYFN